MEIKTNTFSGLASFGITDAINSTRILDTVREKLPTPPNKETIIMGVGGATAGVLAGFATLTSLAHGKKQAAKNNEARRIQFIETLQLMKEDLSSSETEEFRQGFQMNVTWKEGPNDLRHLSHSIGQLPEEVWNSPILKLLEKCISRRKKRFVIRDAASEIQVLDRMIVWLLPRMLEVKDLRQQVASARKELYKSSYIIEFADLLRDYPYGTKSRILKEWLRCTIPDWHEQYAFKMGTLLLENTEYYQLLYDIEHQDPNGERVPYVLQCCKTLQTAVKSRMSDLKDRLIRDQNGCSGRLFF